MNDRTRLKPSFSITFSKFSVFVFQTTNRVACSRCRLLFLGLDVYKQVLYTPCYETRRMYNHLLITCRFTKTYLENMSSSLGLPQSDAVFDDPTPSGLTPNTRSEAEAIFFQNATKQTESAAPDPSIATDEARRAYRRPDMVRASSANYERALRMAHAQSSASSDLGTNNEYSYNIAGSANVASPSQSSPFPAPGQGVVPDYSAVGLSHGDSLKKTRSRGLSLGALAQQQSWNEQDYKRLYNADLMAEVKQNSGYDSGTESKS